jgi:hypothetical protein
MVPMRFKFIVSSYMTRLWYGVSIAWLLSAQVKEGDEEKVPGTLLSPTSREFSISWSKENIPTILEG